MLIDTNAVVTLDYELSDTDGTVLSASKQAMSYLHGGYGAIFAAVETALHGKTAGHEAHIVLSPDAAFGAIDSTLLRAGLRFQAQSNDATIPPSTRSSP